MATSAFRSTTKRTPIAKSSASSTDDSSSSNQSSSAHHRSRSLSRFSRPLPPSGDNLSGDTPLPRGKFVNTVRGLGFPDVTLDDLAVQFFSSADRGRSYSRIDDVSSGDKVSVSQRRGRSVSRHGSRVGEGKANGRNGYVGGQVNSDNNSRRRRSVFVVRYQITDSEVKFFSPFYSVIFNASQLCYGRGFDVNRLSAEEAEEEVAMSSPNSAVSSFHMDFGIRNRSYKRDMEAIDVERASSCSFQIQKILTVVLMPHL
uniref:HD-ZIP protein N-terminal domain-containing protein n=1 Tax=Manihot esculenta TaxID=3983 RepID=A0A2C9V3V6_MANES